MGDRELTIRIDPGSIITAIVIILSAALLIYLHQLVLLLLTAIVIAAAMDPAVTAISRFRVPRVLSVIIVYILVIAVLFGMFYLFIPPLLDDLLGFLSSLPAVIDSIELPSNDLFNAKEAVENFSLQDTIFQLRSVFASTSEGFFKVLSSVFGGLFSFLFVVLFSFYLSIQDRGVEDFLRVVSPLRHEPYVLDLWSRSKRKIGLWMQGQLLLSLIVIILVYLGLTILQVPYALFLALFAGVFELIPVFGSILAAVPVIAVAFVDGGTTSALLAAGLFAIVNQFQGNLIYPLVVKKVVGVPPLLVIVALIVGAQIAGFLGVILSVPVAAVLQEFVSDLDRGKRTRHESLKESS